MAKHNFDPVGTLSIGNVVTTSTILYRSNFKRYLQVSLRATAWLIALVAATVGFITVGSLLFVATQSWLVFIPVSLGWIGITLYLMAKYATDRAVVCRLAYQELIDAPETVSVATGHLRPKIWGFLRLSLLSGLYISLIAFLGYMAFAIAIGIVTWILFTVMPSPGVFTYAILGILGITLVLLWIVIVIRFYAYWFVAELPMAIESTNSASVSLRRSRQLSSNTVRTLVLIITVAFLITLPISGISSVPSLIGQAMTLSDTQSTVAAGSFLIFLGVLLNIAIELFIMPFWQIIKAIVYFDLRNRREGADLII